MTGQDVAQETEVGRKAVLASAANSAHFSVSCATFWPVTQYSTKFYPPRNRNWVKYDKYLTKLFVATVIVLAYEISWCKSPHSLNRKVAYEFRLSCSCKIYLLTRLRTGVFEILFMFQDRLIVVHVFLVFRLQPETVSSQCSPGSNWSPIQQRKVFGVYMW